MSKSVSQRIARGISLFQNEVTFGHSSSRAASVNSDRSDQIVLMTDSNLCIVTK